MPKLYSNQSRTNWDNVEVEEQRTFKDKFLIFAKIASIESSTYWKEIFVKFSKGDIPKTIKYTTKKLSYNSIMCKLTHRPKKDLNPVKEFLVNTNLYKEEIKKKVIPQQDKSDNIRLWKNCDKISKKQLISRFSFHMMIKKELSEKQRIEVMSHIDNLISTGTVKCGDVIVKNNNIKKIYGFSYTGHGKYFEITSEIHYKKIDSIPIQNFPIIIKRKNGSKKKKINKNAMC